MQRRSDPLRDLKIDMAMKIYKVNRPAASRPLADPTAFEFASAHHGRVSAEGGSDALQLAFLHHPLVRLTQALDPVLQLTIDVRKLPHDLILAVRGGLKRMDADQLNLLAWTESVLGHCHLPRAPNSTKTIGASGHRDSGCFVSSAARDSSRRLSRRVYANVYSGDRLALRPGPVRALGGGQASFKQVQILSGIRHGVW
jgi:hypothetical protein